MLRVLGERDRGRVAGHHQLLLSLQLLDGLARGLGAAQLLDNRRAQILRHAERD